MALSICVCFESQYCYCRGQYWVPILLSRLMAEEKMPYFILSMQGKCPHKLPALKSMHHNVVSSTFQYYTQSGHLVWAQILLSKPQGPHGIARKREKIQLFGKLLAPGFVLWQKAFAINSQIYRVVSQTRPTAQPRRHPFEIGVTI